jgi:hypothetical protein
MKVSWVQTLIPLLISFSLSACNAYREKPHDEAHHAQTGTVLISQVSFLILGKLVSHQVSPLRRFSRDLRAIRVSDRSTLAPTR